MSYVTSLMLTFSVAESEDLIEKELELFQQTDELFTIVSIENKKLPVGWYGGTKFMNSNVYLGSYNHFDLDAFIEHLRKIEWDSPGSVQLFVKQDFQSGFTVFNLFPDETDGD